MLDTLRLLAIGAWLLGYAIGNISCRKAFKAIPLGLAIAYRAAAAFISAVAAAFASGVALVISVVGAVLFKSELGLSDDGMRNVAFVFVTSASLSIALLATRLYYTTALREPNERRGP